MLSPERETRKAADHIRSRPRRGSRAVRALRDGICSRLRFCGAELVYTGLVSTASPQFAAEAQIREFFLALYKAWGRQHWWPARSRFEVIVGAFLTQNTAWTNVEKAMARLRQAGVLSIDGIRRTPQAKLERFIRSAGYFRQKAQRLKNFVAYLDRRYAGSLTRMFATPTQQLRSELLRLNGIGSETADSILLYAGNHPVFVVDAYTRRILERHGLVSPSASYDDIRRVFENALRDTKLPAVPMPGAPAHRMPRGSSHQPSRMSQAQRAPLAQVYNEMHGLLVGLGKNLCQKSRALCQQCPLGVFLPQGPIQVSRAAEGERERAPGARANSKVGPPA